MPAASNTLRDGMSAETEPTEAEALPDSVPPPPDPGNGAVDVPAVVKRIADLAAERFKKSQIIKSYQEFLADVYEHPLRHTRNAARYLYEMFEFFGRRNVPGV